jgi:hypothetical protein
MAGLVGREPEIAVIDARSVAMRGSAPIRSSRSSSSRSELAGLFVVPH